MPYTTFSESAKSRPENNANRFRIERADSAVRQFNHVRPSMDTSVYKFIGIAFMTSVACARRMYRNYQDGDSKAEMLRRGRKGWNVTCVSSLYSRDFVQCILTEKRRSYHLATFDARPLSARALTTQRHILLLYNQPERSLREPGCAA